MNTADCPPAVSVPGHTLLRCIGHGSYGQVWLARSHLQAYRAVKIVRRSAFEHARPFERELSGHRRFQPLPRPHQGLVNVLQAGVNEELGYCYYVMELADDLATGQHIRPEFYSPKTLARQISRHGKLPAQECLRLKPSNVIFVKGTPKLADIGLVARLHEACSYVGTEGFIPPEGPGSPQADIYSLGKLLYEASTGKDRREFPELPSRLDQFQDNGLLLELNEVILRACHTNLRKRYRSARQLHADLRLLAGGKSVRHQNRSQQRRTGLRLILGAGLLAAIAVAAVLHPVRHETWRAAARHRLAAASVARGTRALESGDLPGSLPHFVEALRLDADDPDQSAQNRLRIGSVLAQCPALDQMWFSGCEIADAGFSPDGRAALIGDRSGRIRRVDTLTGRTLAPSIHEADVRSACFSPDGTRIVSAGGGGMARVWNAADGSLLLTLVHTDAVFSARFSPDGASIVTGCGDGRARVWDAGDGTLKRVLALHSDAVLAATFSRDGRWIATASRDRTAQVWKAETGQAAGLPLRHPAWVTGVAFSPDNARLLTACLDYAVRIWEAPSGARPLRSLNHRDGILAAGFSPDGRWLLTASLHGTVRLWDAESLEPSLQNAVLNHGSPVTRACFDPAGRRVLTASADGVVRLWTLSRSAPVLESQPPVPGGGPGPVMFSPDGARRLEVSGSRVEVRSSGSGRPVFLPLEHPAPVVHAEFSPDGSRLVTCCADPGVAGWFAQVWDAATGRPVGSRLRHRDGVLFATFSPDGSRVVTASEDFTAVVWDASTGRPLTRGLRHENHVREARFSPDGKWIVTASADGTARIWSAETGDPLTPPLRQPAPLCGARFLPGRRRVVTVDEQGRSWIWTFPVEDRPVEDLAVLAQLISAGALAPDGQMAPLPPESLKELWRRHSAKLPPEPDVSNRGATAIR
jgi:WD40 repeat protein